MTHLILLLGVLKAELNSCQVSDSSMPLKIGAAEFYCCRDDIFIWAPWFDQQVIGSTLVFAVVSGCQVSKSKHGQWPSQLSGSVLMKTEEGYPSWQVLIPLTVKHWLQSFISTFPSWDQLLLFDGSHYESIALQRLVEQEAWGLKEIFLFHNHEYHGMFFSKPLDFICCLLQLVSSVSVVGILQRFCCFACSYWIHPVRQVTWRDRGHPQLASEVFRQPRHLFFLSVMKYRFLGW